MRPADTSPEAWEVFLEVQRRMTPEEKVARMFEWSEIVRQFAEAGIRQRHPHADELEVRLRYTRMTLGQELFRKAYGDALPDDE